MFLEALENSLTGQPGPTLKDLKRTLGAGSLNLRVTPEKYLTLLHLLDIDALTQI